MKDLLRRIRCRRCGRLFATRRIYAEHKAACLAAWQIGEQKPR